MPKFNLFRENEGRVRSLARAEFDRLVAELPEHPADMATFAVTTGLRAANVKGLEWPCVDLERAHAWIPASKHKNRKPHSVLLTTMALQVLHRHAGKHSTRVFTYKGKPVGRLNTKAWSAALKRAGIEDSRWHDLRHTFATWHRLAGTPTHELQNLGGRKTPAMVDRYAHLAPESLQAAAARFDAFAGYAAATDKEKGPSA